MGKELIGFQTSSGKGSTSFSDPRSFPLGRGRSEELFKALREQYGGGTPQLSHYNQFMSPATEFTQVPESAYTVIDDNLLNRQLNQSFATHQAGASQAIRDQSRRAVPGSTSQNRYARQVGTSTPGSIWQRAYAGIGANNTNIRNQAALANAQQGLRAGGLQAQIESAMAMEDINRARALTGMQDVDQRNRNALLNALQAYAQPRPFSQQQSSSLGAQYQLT